MMQRRGLRFELLEQRILLAGDVIWTLKSGSLTVIGDNNLFGNQIEISYRGDNEYELRGLTGTG